MDWVIKNKEWLFSGIGVLALTLLGRFIFLRRKRAGVAEGQSQSVSSRGNQSLSEVSVANQTSGPQGTNISAVTYHHHEGFGIKEFNELAVTLSKQNFPELRREAMIEVRNRVDSFLGELGPRLQERLTAEEFTRFKQPEIQYSFNQSLEAVAVTTAPDLRRMLADLVIKRVSSDAESLDAIVYGEAIKTVSKLTPEMLSILALKAYLLLGLDKIETWDDLKTAHARYISPLLPFSDSIINFQHLAYAGCGTLSGVAFNPTGLIGLLRDANPTLFQRSVSQQQIGYLNLRPELAEALFLREPDGGYRFRCKSLEQVKGVCSGPEDLQCRALQAVPNLFVALLGTPDENRALLLTRLPEFDLAIRLISVTLTNMFRLSSVGLAIGTIHLESKTGLKLEVNFSSPLPEPETGSYPHEMGWDHLPELRGIEGN